MQWDDDSYITGRPPYNLVQEMDRGQYLLAARKVVTEPPMVVWGLAELTKYFLLTYQGTVHKAGPQGLSGVPPR